ncbi:uncharacterized protein E5676_scaffold828G00650 [Cucumis melo var. makuwa]|uniref:Uncharacterized protein n=1 Tax=Cucumis melo var. makuwa TaxID=1194695 RepID=A0A5D3CKI0_CUCMM|nr:uncharacterized protein E6C27_scaffold508G00680 [Cucumis melo var. makuwa]TYK11688.1 uncharacterized protein E5676_scaffold828G00650 [Cucumis melo var. makuwa]
MWRSWSLSSRMSHIPEKTEEKLLCHTVNEEFGDSRDDDCNINAFTIRITDENTDDESECSEESKNDELTIEKLKALWKEDCKARAIQKERIQDLIRRKGMFDVYNILSKVKNERSSE